jgi:hypothetical protein
MRNAGGGGRGGGRGAGGEAGCGAAAGGAIGGGRGSVDPLDQWLPLGDYTVTLEVAGQKRTQTARIAHLQGWSIGGQPQIIR